MKRSSPIRRSAPRRKRRGPRRGPANIPREEWRNEKYKRFLRYEGFCVVCGRRPQMGCDPAHGPVNGTSSKGPDSGCIPLCRDHHNEQTASTWPAFEAKYNFTREEEAAIWWTTFRGKQRA